MSYLLFHIEDYYPGGGMTDIKSVCSSKADLIEIIKESLIEEKESLVRKRDAARKSIEETKDEIDNYDYKNSNFSLGYFENELIYYENNLKKLYDANKYSLYFEYHVLNTDDMKLYVLSEEDLISMMGFDDNIDKLVITEDDLDKFLKEDSFYSEKISEAMNGRKIIIS